MPILRGVVLSYEAAVAGRRSHRGEITSGLHRCIAEGGHVQGGCVHIQVVALRDVIVQHLRLHHGRSQTNHFLGRHKSRLARGPHGLEVGLEALPAAEGRSEAVLQTFTPVPDARLQRAEAALELTLKAVALDLFL